MNKENLPILSEIERRKVRFKGVGISLIISPLFD